MSIHYLCNKITSVIKSFKSCVLRNTK